MLILSRKQRQRVIVTVPGRKPIIVEVIDIRGDKVRLGFEADQEVVIHREEIQHENEARERGHDPA